MNKDNSKNRKVKLETAKITVGASTSVTAEVEKRHLAISNKKRCKKILAKSKKTEKDIIDFLISLHLLLEVNLSAFYRQIVNSKGLSKLTPKNPYKVIKELDEISFIDKTILFIYFSNIKFNSNKEEAIKHHSIIQQLKTFCGVRNKLLHGHAIAERKGRGIEAESEAKKVVSKKMMDRQINLFIDICKGVGFYLDCLESGLTDSGKDQFKKAYLDYEFLEDYINNENKK